MDGLARARLFIRVALSKESRRDLRSLRLNDLSCIRYRRKTAEFERCGPQGVEEWQGILLSSPGFVSDWVSYFNEEASISGLVY